MPLVDELRGLDRAVLDVDTVAPDLGVGNDERVPGAHGEHEIDVPTEDVRQADRSLVVGAGGLDRLEERGVDRCADGAGTDLQRILNEVGGKPRGHAAHLESFGLAEPPLEAEQLAVPVRQVQRFAGVQRVEARAHAGEHPHGGQICQAQFQTAEDAVQRVVARDDDVDGRECKPRSLERGVSSQYHRHSDRRMSYRRVAARSRHFVAGGRRVGSGGEQVAGGAAKYVGRVRSGRGPVRGRRRAQAAVQYGPCNHGAGGNLQPEGPTRCWQPAQKPGERPPYELKCHRLDLCA